MAKKTKKTKDSVEDQLKALHQLQVIDTKIDKIRIIRGELPLEIEDLEEPEMIEKILRREGYGKEGEIIYIVKVPEPVPPLSEIFSKENKKSLVEKFIDFITGRDENQ